MTLARALMVARIVLILCSFILVEADFDAPKYTIDLDRLPSERWGPLVEDMLDLHGWNKSFGPVIDYMTNITPLEDWRKHDFAFQGVGLGLLGFEYLEECRGVYAVARKRGFGDKLTAGMLVFFQLFYELLMECTGIVAQTPDGSVTHGRNMDIGLPVTNITAQVTWIRGGKDVLITTQYLGYFGVHTGMRVGGWSVQANERVLLEIGPWGWEKTVVASDLLALLEHHKPVGYVLREALLGVTTFDGAVKHLADVKIVAPLYFIMAGANPGEGAVITKNRNGLANLPNNKSVLLLNESNKFYLSQTNWDPTIPIDAEQCKGLEEALPLEVRSACSKVLKLLYGSTGGCMSLCELTSDGRHERTVMLLDAMGKDKVSSDNLFKVLSDSHVEQSITQFTALIHPASGDYRTIVREHGQNEKREPNPFFQRARAMAEHLFRSLIHRAEVVV